MRNTEMRTAAVARRITELNRARRNRRMAWITGAAAAACLCLLIGFSVIMPTLDVHTAPGADYGAAASIFADHASFGYAVIGILGFLLGIALTLLCVILHRHDRGAQP